MIKRILFILTTVCCVMMAADFKADLQLELKSRRISKGKVSNPDPVGLLDFKASYYGFYAGVFGINDLTDYNKAKNVDRYDFERFEWRAGYEASTEYFKYDIGYLYTDYTNEMQKDEDPRHEVYLKLTGSCFLSPGLKFNYDTQHEYLYINPSIKHTYVFSEKLELKSELHVYLYNRKQMKAEWKINREAFTCVYFKTYLRYKLNDKVSFGPLMEASYALDGSVRDAWRESSKNSAGNFLFGLKCDIKL